MVRVTFLLLTVFNTFILLQVSATAGDIENRRNSASFLAPPRCALPPVEGECGEAHQRWFYSALAGRCLSFMYRGCKGNENNFDTIEDCSRVCTNEIGYESLDDGTGQAPIQDVLPEQQLERWKRTTPDSSSISTNKPSPFSIGNQKDIILSTSSANTMLNTATNMHARNKNKSTLPGQIDASNAVGLSGVKMRYTTDAVNLISVTSVPKEVVKSHQKLEMTSPGVSVSSRAVDLLSRVISQVHSTRNPGLTSIQAISESIPEYIRPFAEVTDEVSKQSSTERIDVTNATTSNTTDTELTKELSRDEIEDETESNYENSNGDEFSKDDSTPENFDADSQSLTETSREQDNEFDAGGLKDEDADVESQEQFDNFPVFSVDSSSSNLENPSEFEDDFNDDPLLETSDSVSDISKKNTEDDEIQSASNSKSKIPIETKDSNVSQNLPKINKSELLFIIENNNKEMTSTENSQRIYELEDSALLLDEVSSHESREDKDVVHLGDNSEKLHTKDEISGKSEIQHEQNIDMPVLDEIPSANSIEELPLFDEDYNQILYDRINDEEDSHHGVPSLSPRDEISDNISSENLDDKKENIVKFEDRSQITGHLVSDKFSDSTKSLSDTNDPLNPSNVIGLGKSPERDFDVFSFSALNRQNIPSTSFRTFEEGEQPSFFRTLENFHPEFRLNRFDAVYRAPDHKLNVPAGPMRKELLPYAPVGPMHKELLSYVPGADKARPLLKSPPNEAEITEMADRAPQAPNFLNITRSLTFFMPFRTFEDNQSFPQGFPSLFDRNHQKSLSFPSANTFLERPNVLINGMLRLRDPRSTVNIGEFDNNFRKEFPQQFSQMDMEPHFKIEPDHQRFQFSAGNERIPHPQTWQKMQIRDLDLPFELRGPIPFNGASQSVQQYELDPPWTQRTSHGGGILSPPTFVRDHVNNNMHLQKPNNNVHPQNFDRQENEAGRTSNHDMKSEVRSHQPIQEYSPESQINFSNTPSAQSFPYTQRSDTNKNGNTLQDTFKRDKILEGQTIHKMNHINFNQEQPSRPTFNQFSPLHLNQYVQNDHSQRLADNFHHDSRPENRQYSQPVSAGALTDKGLRGSVNLLPQGARNRDEDNFRFAPISKEQSLQLSPFLLHSRNPLPTRHVNQPRQRDGSFFPPMNYFPGQQFSALNENPRLPLLDHSVPIQTNPLGNMLFPSPLQRFINRPLRIHLSRPVQNYLTSRINPPQSPEETSRKSGVVKAKKLKKGKKTPKKAAIKKVNYHTGEERSRVQLSPQPFVFSSSDMNKRPRNLGSNRPAQSSDASTLNQEYGVFNKKSLEDFGIRKLPAVNPPPNNKFTFLQVFVNKQNSEPNFDLNSPTNNGPSSSSPDSKRLLSESFNYPQTHRQEPDRFQYPQLPINGRRHDDRLMQGTEEFQNREKSPNDGRIRDNLEEFKYRRLTELSVTTDRRNGFGELPVPVYSVCLLPLDAGKCKSFQNKWYFNEFSRSCEMFYYGGCGSINGNRFNTHVDCMHACKAFLPSKELDRDQIPPDDRRAGRAQLSPNRGTAVTTDSSEDVIYVTSNVYVSDFEYTSTGPLPTTGRDVSAVHGTTAEETNPGGIMDGSDSRLYRKEKDKKIDIEESAPVLSKQYITIVAVLGVVGLAIILLVIISIVHLCRRVKKTKKELVIEEVVKSHMYGDLSQVVYSDSPVTLEKCEKDKYISEIRSA